MSDPDSTNALIVVYLMGGLGNQMFQYAFGRRMALANDARLVLDASGYHSVEAPDPALGARACGLSHLCIVGQIVERPETELHRTIPIRRWIRKVRQAAIRLGDKRKPYFLRQEIVEPEEQHFQFDGRVFARRIHGAVSVRGFWQTEAYFRDMEDTIRKELRLRRELRGKNADVATQILGCTAVTVHVRHGDNANAVAAQLGVLPREYYERAMQEIGTEVQSPHFFVFSDDIAWARVLLGHDRPYTFIDHNGAEGSHEDMRLMTMCQHHIIANSTFGWWGAWLAKHPGQMVIAPRRYYLGVDRPNPDLYPESWRLL
jgi:hypothetical protein